MGGAHFGKHLSVLDFVHLGSSLSVGTILTEYVGLKHNAGTPSPSTQTPPTNTYTKYSETDIKLYAEGQLALTATVDGGMLHGAWSSEATVTISDRRLKTSIEPLYRTLAARARDHYSPNAEQTTAADVSSSQVKEPVGWLLRELRPVSFRLKRGPEAKYLKFGFIAQELETVFPNLVRTTGVDDTKAVASQDLIAVLTLALQNLQRQFETQQRELEEQRQRMDRLVEEQRNIWKVLGGAAAGTLQI